MSRALDQAVSQAEKTLQEFEKQAKSKGLDAGFLAGVNVILGDGRLRERVLDLSEQEGGLARGLGGVSAEAARAASRAGDAFGLSRVREISDVCEALAMLTANDRRAEVPRNAVLVGDQFTVFDLLVSARSQPAAVVLSERANHDVAKTLLGVLGVPAVVEVAGLFRWVSDGDIALVDGDHGLVRLNPGRAEVSLALAEKKKSG
jgi:phosphotransferase system enzyme I (PtsP)